MNKKLLLVYFALCCTMNYAKPPIKVANQPIKCTEGEKITLINPVIDDRDTYIVSTIDNENEGHTTIYLRNIDPHGCDSVIEQTEEKLISWNDITSLLQKKYRTELFDARYKQIQNRKEFHKEYPKDKFPMFGEMYTFVKRSHSDIYGKIHAIARYEKKYFFYTSKATFHAKKDEKSGEVEVYEELTRKYHASRCIPVGAALVGFGYLIYKFKFS